MEENHTKLRLFWVTTMLIKSSQHHTQLKWLFLLLQFLHHLLQNRLQLQQFNKVAQIIMKVQAKLEAVVALLTASEAWSVTARFLVLLKVLVPLVAVEIVAEVVVLAVKIAPLILALLLILQALIALAHSKIIVLAIVPAVVVVTVLPQAVVIKIVVVQVVKVQVVHQPHN